MAVLAPIPKAMVTMAVKAKAGLLRTARRARVTAGGIAVPKMDL